MSVTEPSKILTPWASTGLKNTIPQEANPVTGNAGYDQGFPAINMTPKEAGGIPPYGQDFNGILNDITKIIQFIQAGGYPSFSQSLSTAVGGYGKGAILLGDDKMTLWQNTKDGNLTNPDMGGENWINLLLSILPKRTFSSNDFIRIPDTPGGLIIQWGSATISGSAPLAFASKFPNAALSVVTNPDENSDSYAFSQAVSITTSGFNCVIYGARVGAAPSVLSVPTKLYWIGVGF